MIKNISVVIIAKDAEDTIKECLESLIDFNEVILYLNNSSDSTSNIANKFTNVQIAEGTFIGFGPTKNRASSYASNDWILSLDSDEILNSKLIEELKTIDLSNNNNIFKLKRDNYFLGHIVKYSGWGNDYIYRIYNRTQHNFNLNLVHENIELDKKSNKIKLVNSFKHLNILNINQTLEKTISYTDLGAKDKKICFFPIVLLKAIFAFFQTYILRLGILDGWIGIVISITYANRRFYKYLKQYINCKN